MAKERVLLKISGEALSGEGGTGYDRDRMEYIAKEILSIAGTHQTTVIVGGGNHPRGSKLKSEVFGADVVEADQMGMLYTVTNVIALRVFLEQRGLRARALSAHEMKDFCEPYIRLRATRHLEKGRIVLLAGGTGNPDCSTDSAMTLRAYELGIKTVLKGTKVAGIYDDDPRKNPEAALLSEVGYMEYLNRGLGIVDNTAVTQAQRHKMEIRVFDFFQEGNLLRAVGGEVGSVIR